MRKSRFCLNVEGKVKPKMCLDMNLFPKKKKKKFKMVLCQRLQKYIPISLKNGMCAYPHKGPLCEGCRKNHSFTLERTASILASELEGGKKVLPHLASKRAIHGNKAEKEKAS